MISTTNEHSKACGAKKIEMNTTLFKFAIGVKPTPFHPLYYEWQWGWLLIWIYGADFESARNNAARIAAALPYEFTEVNANGWRIRPMGELKQLPPGHKCFGMPEVMENWAKNIGFSMMLDSASTGTDEPPDLFQPPAE